MLLICCSVEDFERHKRGKVREKTAKVVVPAKPQKAPGHRSQAEQPKAFAVQAKTKAAKDRSAGIRKYINLFVSM